jgi:hypothetical protein
MKKPMKPDTFEASFAMNRCKMHLPVGTQTFGGTTGPDDLDEKPAVFPGNPIDVYRNRSFGNNLCKRDGTKEGQKRI